ncbi:hypothetical protein [Sediminibacterium sp.]|uniref:hypothetical protein n=1 Tax=Sediminibacterium sp. TaxID=1917865 RepID=UPI0025DE5E9A|nr:hypothetical protein [Sediminibacterium sp.]
MDYKTNLKIAIQVISFEMNHAYDRRRVLPFLREFNVENRIEYVPFTEIKSLDLNQFHFVIVSIRSDLPYIYKILSNSISDLKPKLIFDYCDFIHVINDLGFYIKSIFAKRRNNYSDTFSKKHFLELLSLFDSIVVGSTIQKNIIEQFNKKVTIIQDITEEIPLLEMKKGELDKGILWEGFASSNWSIFKKIFKYANNIPNPSTLYIVTDQKYYFLAGRYFGFQIQTIFNFFSFFYPKNKYETRSWSVNNLVNYANKSKVAMIPISNNKIAQLKPENKVVIMIRLGLLPIVSNIPAYEEFSKKYDLDICFSNLIEFKRIYSDLESHFSKLELARPTILDDYSYDNIKSKWEKIFEI